MFMNRFILSICTVLSLFVFSCSGKSEKLLLGGSGWNKIAIVDKNTKQIEWEHPLEKGWECNSVVATPDGNILFSYRKGAKLIDHDHNEIWDIPAPEKCEMQTARLLPDGNYLLAWCGHPAVIMEVNAKGEVLSRTEYETGIERAHSQFRQVGKNADGNYLLPLMKTSELREISPSGEMMNRMKLKGGPFTVVPASDDTYWVACGDAHLLMEVDLRTGDIIRCYNENDIEGARLFFVAGLASSNNSLYVCNWQGHAKKNSATNSPQVFEINNEGQVIWSLNDTEKFGKISSISVIR
ncbi:hypothetical protein [Bacteroides sp.]|uniref:beta-propeller domain-containing protein n=1 Tax=Bacteroides sp. TaxID=29523 RepID=UPI0025C596AF|nr:hypothetical protein [Bacteroides sp.]